MIEFKIQIKPQSKQSTRFGRGHSYTCAKKRKYSNNLEAQIQQQCKKVKFPKGKKLALSVEFAFAWRRTDKQDTWFDRTPDLDNMLKPLQDAMNGIVMEDDSQIVMYKEVKKTRRKGGDYILVKLEDVGDLEQ